MFLVLLMFFFFLVSCEGFNLFFKLLFNTYICCLLFLLCYGLSSVRHTTVFVTSFVISLSSQYVFQFLYINWFLALTYHIVQVLFLNHCFRLLLIFLVFGILSLAHCFFSLSFSFSGVRQCSAYSFSTSVIIMRNILQVSWFSVCSLLSRLFAWHMDLIGTV